MLKQECLLKTTVNLARAMFAGEVLKAAGYFSYQMR
jgi:hypothetical protein